MSSHYKFSLWFLIMISHYDFALWFLIMISPYESTHYDFSLWFIIMICVTKKRFHITKSQNCSPSWYKQLTTIFVIRVIRFIWGTGAHNNRWKASAESFSNIVFTSEGCAVVASQLVGLVSCAETNGPSVCEYVARQVAKGLKGLNRFYLKTTNLTNKTSQII